ncbi:MAG TPA: glycoside hydrolase family 92 protein, partial [Prolixibacteraceae bacterium]|nr:glycoside hydrolase family 92 protein [Prolixibacteraceae bacterium]
MNTVINLIRRKTAVALIVLTSVLALTRNSAFAKEPVDYVNPYMGNISHLLVPTFPTIHLPNSMLRVYPERGDYTAVEISGLPLIVTSHRGSSAFNLSPFQGDVKKLQPVVKYSYDQEKLTPYSYQVYLDEQEILVNYGLSHQSAAYEIQFEKHEPAYIVINSRNGSLKWDGKAISGYQQLSGDTRVYLYLVLDQKPLSVSSLNDGNLVSQTSANGK